MSEPTKALREYLANAVSDAAVYGGRLPQEAVKTDPADTIVVRFVGNPGAMGSGYQTYGDARVDVRCLAATDIEAAALHGLAHAALKRLRRHVGTDGTVVHWARPSGGGGLSEDPDTGWPQVLSSWQCLVDATP